jgi:Rrf2 family protein
MQVSREMDYAIRAAVVLAASEGRIVSKREISETVNIPRNFLAIILPRLVRGGLIESLPGPRGGYRLAKAAGSVSLYDIIAVIDSGFALNKCLSNKHTCELKESCPVTSYWQELQGKVVQFLQGVRLDVVAAGSVCTKK